MTSAIRILSLGWGVQSWTLAAMMALGELPRADYLVHADTTWEREATYAFSERWTPWLEKHGLNVVTVKSDRTKVLERWVQKTEGVMIPAFTVSADGSHGQLRRQCTNVWKVQPIRRFVADELRKRGWSKRPGIVGTVMGISRDEFMRMRDSDVQYVVNEYPLVDLRMSRQDCVVWLERHDLPVPVKSSCVFCPYHSRGAWQRMGRDGGPDWKVAVHIDEAVRNKRGPYPLFVHPLRRPLREAAEDDGQVEMWPEAACDSGYCFV